MSEIRPFLVDVSRLIWRFWNGRLPTGIDRVCLAYVEHYQDGAQAVVQWRGKLLILSTKISHRLFKLLLSDRPGFRRHLILLTLRHPGLFFTSEKGHGRLYLNVGHSGLDRVTLGRAIAEADVRPIYMLHDLIPITHPEFCRAESQEKHKRRLTAMLDTAAGIIGNSHDTLDILNSYAADIGRDVPPALAAWLGTVPLPHTALEREGNQTPYFVTLGTIEGRKNHLLLLHLWQRLVASKGAAAPRLLIIGQRGWQNADVLSILDGDESLREHVVELGRCTDAELASHLHGAQALLFPSFVEGYGMPLVEALGHGVPVIASNLAIFRELAGNIPEYLDPCDIDGWQAQVEAYAVLNSPERDAQLERLANYHMPSWTDHFDRVDRWLSAL